MALYQEDKEEVVLSKTAADLETSQILNSSKLNETITNQISGYKWKVNYFNQILDKMDPPNQLDTATNSTTQPYRLIKNLVITLTNPITSASTSNLNGEGYVDMGMAVFKYDLFIAEVHNKVAIFYVEEVRADTYENNTIYYIIFKFFCFTSDVDTYNNLLSKVVTEYTFNPNYKFTNEKQILLKAEVYNYQKAVKYVQTVMMHYYQRFFNTKLNMLMDTNSSGDKILDIHLNRFIKSTIPTNIVGWVNKIEYQDLEEYSCLNIFDCLTKSLELRMVDKLYVSAPQVKYNSVFYKDVIKVKAMSDVNGDKINFYSKDYFIEDSFYTKSLDMFEAHEKFEIVLYRAIHGKEITPEEIQMAIDSSKTDEFRYYKIPILIYIYLRAIEKIKF